MFAFLVPILLPYVVCNVGCSFVSRSLTEGMKVEDKNHLKEHLDPHVDVDSMSLEEIRFRYFKTHDTDGDNRLDGIEIIQAILHFQGEDDSIGPLQYSFTDNELELFVDPIFTKSDSNDDGFLDFAEFMSLQIAESDL